MEAEDEGMSTPKKVATGAAVGLATAAAVGVGKKLLGSDDTADEPGDEPQSTKAGGSSTGGRAQSTSSRASKSRSGGSKSNKSSSASMSRSSSKSRSGSSGQSKGRTRTKEQLYAQAKRLKIDGRSTMTKAQLERAVQRARA
jgi:hypothetical protein